MTRRRGKIEEKSKTKLAALRGGVGGCLPTKTKQNRDYHFVTSQTQTNARKLKKKARRKRKGSKKYGPRRGFVRSDVGRHHVVFSAAAGHPMLDELSALHFLLHAHVRETRVDEHVDEVLRDGRTGDSAGKCLAGFEVRGELGGGHDVGHRKAAGACRSTLRRAWKLLEVFFL